MKEYGNAVRVGRDQLREMLHFSVWSGKNEGITKDVQREVVRHLLERGKVVIVDDTNVQNSRVESWKQLAKELGTSVVFEKMETTIEECIRRDAARDYSVGRDVIIAMALQAGLYPKPKKGFVLCDIDGTLADIKHRMHFVRDLPEGQKKNWDGFFAHMYGDTPRLEVVDMLLTYEDEGYEIIFVSARPDKYRAFTEEWIESKAFKGYRIFKTLLMRREGDRRPDTDVKKDILDHCFLANGYSIHKVIDDRPSVIRMWRDHGLDVIDVGEGVEF